MAENPNTTAWKNYKTWRAAQGNPVGHEATALRLVEMEAASPGYLSVNEREFVMQVLGPDSLDKP